MAMFGAFRTLVLASVVGLAWSQCGQPVFKVGAENEVQASFKETRRGTDYTTIEVPVIPYDLVENYECTNADQMVLEYKTGEEDWTAVEGKAKSLGGGRYKFTIQDVIPCRSYNLKLWVEGDGGNAGLELSTQVAAASPELLANARYIPDEPTFVSTQVDGSGGVLMSWTPSECTQTYEISYVKSGSTDEANVKVVPASEGNSVTLSEGLEACKDYKYEIYAVIGDEYSSEVEGYFSTAPDPSSGTNLTPLVTHQVDKLEVSWPFAELSCVPKYEVSICKVGEECDETNEVPTPVDQPNIVFTSGILDQCSPYEISIKPIYEGVDIEAKMLQERTLAPQLEDVAEKLLPVVATAKGAQLVKVSWSPVECAEQYVVFQKQELGGMGDWEKVSETNPDETSKEFSGVPCTAYSYGVKVIIDGKPSEIMEIDEPITTHLESTEAFVAPNLEITPTPTGAILTWDHGACITGYRVRACQRDSDADIACIQDEFDVSSTEHNISRTVEGLEPCSPHYVEIYPNVGNEDIAPTPKDFVTSSPEASPPEEDNIYLSEDMKTVHLNWTYVKCATGYKILQEITDEVITSWETADVNLLSTSLQNQHPCVTYKYGIASVLGDDVSEPTKWTEIKVPPRNDEENKPKMEVKVRDTENDTLTLVINSDGDNNNCPIEAYNLKYNSEDTTIPAEEAMEGEIVLEFKGASGIEVLEARMKYRGFDAWTGWTNNREIIINNSKGESSSSDMLVPIVIGVLVAVIILVVIIFFIIKKRKTNQKYDTEKADGATEETEKLNDNGAAKA